MTNKTIMSWYRSLLFLALFLYAIFIVLFFSSDNFYTSDIFKGFFFLMSFPFGFLIIARLYNLLAYGKWVVEEGQ